METLFLSSKKLTTFDQIYLQTKNPKTIKRLDLSHNKIQELPNNLSKFVNLSVLNLNGNPIKKVFSQGGFYYQRFTISPKTG